MQTKKEVCNLSLLSSSSQILAYFVYFHSTNQGFFMLFYFLCIPPKTKVFLIPFQENIP